jgi:predicted nucleotidyltransferase
VTDWLPMDGDTFVTTEGFIFNVFGYEHPDNRVLAFLKYIPADFKALFNVRYLENTWTYKTRQVFRAEKLYTAQNYQTFLATFKTNFPKYVYTCPYRRKDLISSPTSSIKDLYLPKECLSRLTNLSKKDDLQKSALDLIELLSNESHIQIEDFGLHGSIALNMHSPKSDIDLVVYGSQNFRRLVAAIDHLVKNGALSYAFKNRVEEARHFKGKYRGNLFMYNAVRKPFETTPKYGFFQFTPVSNVRLECVVKDDSETMFRPAIYKVANIRYLSAPPGLAEDTAPEIVVSMIGCYRNVARKGDRIRVSGTLERAENLETKQVYHQVVVGTGTNEDEHIWPM